MLGDNYMTQLMRERYAIRKEGKPCASERKALQHNASTKKTTVCITDLDKLNLVKLGYFHSCLKKMAIA